MTRARVEFDQLKRLAPVVIGGKVAVLLMAEMTLLLIIVTVTLATGAPPSELIKTGLVCPAMILIALCSADTVASLRRSGELELAVTLSSPARMIVRRLLPVFAAALVQTAVVALVFLLFLHPGDVALGLLFSFIPLALAGVASLYWNLRFRGAASVSFATLLTLLPAFIWIAGAHVTREHENSMLPLSTLVFSFLRCQAGLLLAAVCLGALARRRLSHAEDLLDER